MEPTIIFVIVDKASKKPILALDSKEDAEKIATDSYEIIETIFTASSKKSPPRRLIKNNG